jgi:hypothetical protein
MIGYNLSMKELKSICKLKKINNYSKLNKVGLVNILNYNIAIVKIQRFIRLKWVDGLCPISMETVKYPCFAFRPKGFMINKEKARIGTSFIYYNLEPLVNYLLSSGDFRDPKTRELYTPETLKSIDKYKTSIRMKAKSVYRASINKTMYRRKKEIDEDLIVLERCIDEVVSLIRIALETKQQNDYRITLSSFHFPTFHRYFRTIIHKSKEYAQQVLQHTIHLITGPEEHPTLDPNNIKDFILQFMYTLELTYFNEDDN